MVSITQGCSCDACRGNTFSLTWIKMYRAQIKTRSVTTKNIVPINKPEFARTISLGKLLINRGPIHFVVEVAFVVRGPLVFYKWLSISESTVWSSLPEFKLISMYAPVAPNIPSGNLLDSKRILLRSFTTYCVTSITLSVDTVPTL